jgi:predicted O-methyltransferase YrrM
MKPEELPEHIRVAIDTYIPQLGQWLDLNRAYEMAALILETKPEVVVELGSFKGQSLITQAFALRENNKGKIYGIDPWKVEAAIEGSNDPENNEWWSSKIDLNQVHQDCMEQVWAHRLDPWVVVIRAASQHVNQLFRCDIDILYIDANHSEEASTRDVENYVPRVRSGGWVWFDDTDWSSTQKALKIMLNTCVLERDNGNYRLYRKL